MSRVLILLNMIKNTNMIVIAYTTTSSPSLGCLVNPIPGRLKKVQKLAGGVNFTPPPTFGSL